MTFRPRPRIAWRFLASAAWLASLAGLVGCDVDRGRGRYEAQVVPDALGETSTTSRDVGLGAGSGAGTMTGTWMLIHERSTCVTTVQTEEQITRAIYRVEIEQEGAALEESRRLCDIALTPVLGQSIAIDDEVLRNIRFLDVDRGVVSGLGAGGSYTSSTEVAFWGVDPESLDEPLASPLPRSADDRAVVDADDDDRPGVTFDLLGGSCRRYTGQRQLIRYRGTFTTPNRIDGQSTGHTDTVVFGASRGICELAPDIRANDRESRFRMYRIDGRGGALDADRNDDDRIDCSEIRTLPVSEVFEGRSPSDDRCMR